MVISRTNKQRLVSSAPHGPSTEPPQRFVTAFGAITIDLLRRIHPANLLLPEGRVLGLDDWYRHSNQSREYVLVATRVAGSRHEVLGQAELRFDDGSAACRGMIDRVVVQPEYRRQGIGTALLRTALAFARGRRVVALREYVPGLLALVETFGERRWRTYEPAVNELGGLRSLAVTARACTLEGAPCQIVRTTRDRPLRASHFAQRGQRLTTEQEQPLELLGAIVEIPLMTTALPGRPAPATLLTRLCADIAALAGVRWPDEAVAPA